MAIFLSSRDAAGPGDVRHDEVRQPALEDGDELEASVQTLANADADRNLIAHLGQRVVALGRDRLFKPADVVGREPVGESDRGGNVVHRVGIDQELDAGTDGFANAGDDLDAALFDLNWKLSRPGSRCASRQCPTGTGLS